MAEGLLVYVALATIGASVLVGGVAGYWIRAGEDRVRRRRDRRVITAQREQLSRLTAPHRGRRAKEATPND